MGAWGIGQTRGLKAGSLSILFTSVAQAEHRVWHIVGAPDTSELTMDTQHMDNEIAQLC